MTESEKPAEQLEEEPQGERGDPGSRGGGTDEAGGGPADRPVGTTEDDTSVDPQGTADPDMPNMPTGSGG